MSYVGVFFVIIGSMLIIYSDKISKLQHSSQMFFINPLFGWLINFDNPKVKTFYRWYVIFGGLLALFIGIIVLLQSTI